MWRDTMRPLTILGVNAAALIPLGIFFLHVRWWTLYVALGGCLFFVVLQWFGLSIRAMARRLRCKLVGRRRPGIPSWKRRGFA